MQAQREIMVIHGRFDPAPFLAWIVRHARKLGLHNEIAHASGDRIELRTEGPDELLSALEMACLLGPIEAWIDTIDRNLVHEHACDPCSPAFSPPPKNAP
ncbi:acylphosphatase [Rhizobium sp. SL86]|uniref:acylphosphatase n=1 Tax=Rhizobium sp. SL86 TaxID=2995148 RepID=UPI00227582D0|nr:acylphosphatase [Rhizobium sp. SL86]MCY1666385.1 acylphosphatase [Rhizobium sp. SL86]